MADDDKDDARNRIVERIEELEQNQSDRLGNPRDEIAQEYAALYEELSRYDSGGERNEHREKADPESPDKPRLYKTNDDPNLKPEHGKRKDHAPLATVGTQPRLSSAPRLGGGALLQAARTDRQAIEEKRKQRPQKSPEFAPEQGQLKQKAKDKGDRPPQGRPDVVSDRDSIKEKDKRQIDDDFLKEKARGVAKKNFNKSKGIDI